MNTTIRYVLLTALRDKLFLVLFAAIVIAVAISKFLGGTALVEQWQMTVSYLAGSTRVILFVGLIVFICFHVRRAFDQKEVDVMLTRPISRTSFVISYWLGFSVVALLLVAVLTAAMGFWMKVPSEQLFLWAGSLALEALLVVAFALFAALLLKSAVSAVLLCFSFYLISRMMGFFTYLTLKRLSVSSLDVDNITRHILEVLSVTIPRLDLFGKSSWLVYGAAGDPHVHAFIPQALIYTPLLLAMAVFDFKRKQF